MSICHIDYVKMPCAYQNDYVSKRHIDFVSFLTYVRYTGLDVWAGRTVLLGQGT